MKNPVFAKETGIEEAFNYLYLQFIWPQNIGGVNN
jgi:hypothetical protein